MNGNAGNLRRFQGRRLHAATLVVGLVAPDGHLLHFVQDVPSVQDLTKDRVQIVQMRLLFIQNEELGLFQRGKAKGR